MRLGLPAAQRAREDLLDVGLARQVARSLLEENVVQRELVAQRPHHGELVEQPILRGELSPFPELELSNVKS